MKKIKCIFLGYNSKQTRIIDFLKKKNVIIFENENNKITLRQILKYDLCISYGYRKIIDEKILKDLNRPIINLHISYLPYNRGVNPNLNSFLQKTPKGVTIHEINKNIDAGDILFQKKIHFKITKNTTFKDTYLILRKEIEKLFIKNYKKIIMNNYKKFKQRKIKQRKTYKKKIDWNLPIKYILKTKKLK
jgi:methionyl-tRNA formyltransferase